MRKLGGLKVEGEGGSYEAAREKLMMELDRLVRTVASALGRAVAYEEVRIEGDVTLSRSGEVEREGLRGYALVRVGRGRGRVIFSGEVARVKRGYAYRGVVSDVEEAKPSPAER